MSYIFRFPKYPENRKEWIQKYKRRSKWNPNTIYIYSEHFSPDTFVQNMKAELLGYYYYYLCIAVLEFYYRIENE